MLEKFLQAQMQLQAQQSQWLEMMEMIKGRKSVVTKSEEEKSTELYCRLKSLISEFQSDVEKGITFDSSA